MTKRHKVAAFVFEFEEVGEICQWQGYLAQACKAPAVGKGLFCDPAHYDCKPIDICSRHKQ